MNRRTFIKNAGVATLSGPNLIQRVSANVEPSPKFLTLPFSQAIMNALGGERIGEAWKYTEGEKAIHGITDHLSIDYELPYGTPIYAPCDGYGMSSYYNTTWTDPATKQLRQYEGKTINYGLGKFVQIWNPERDIYVQGAHLSETSDNIPFHEGKYIGDDTINAVNHDLPHEQRDQAIKDGRRVQVKQGDLIGHSGVSGLERGRLVDEKFDHRQIQTELENNSALLDLINAGGIETIIVEKRRELQQVFIRDGCHLHFQNYLRNKQGAKVRGSARDPYGLYLQDIALYPTHVLYKPSAPLGSDHMFLTDQIGLPLYATN